MANGHADERAKKAIWKYPSNAADRGLIREYEVECEKTRQVARIIGKIAQVFR